MRPNIFLGAEQSLLYKYLILPSFILPLKIKIIAIIRISDLVFVSLNNAEQGRYVIKLD